MKMSIKNKTSKENKTKNIQKKALLLFVSVQLSSDLNLNSFILTVTQEKKMFFACLTFSIAVFALTP